MAVDTTLLALAVDLSSANVSLGLDMSEGSAFRTSFLDPLLTRAGASHLSGDMETLLVERIKEQVPEADVSAFSAHRDLVIRAFALMAEPAVRETNAIALTQSLLNASSMTRAELNSLLANYYTQLRDGVKTRGTVRMYYPSARSVTVTPTTQFSTGSGLLFYPLTTQQINSIQMGFQQEGLLFYFDVLVESQSAGSEYNVSAGSIGSVVGAVGVTRVTNLAKFTKGTAAETNEEGVARTRNSITVRNLITSRGAAFVIPEAFPVVEALQVIGRGDPEMLRDVVNGPVAISGVPGGLIGKQDPDVLAGQHVHIGGMTDIYVHQSTPDTSDLDVENITDVGVQVYAGSHGATDAGAATSTFRDEYGFFTKRGVVAGDVLRLGAAEYPIANVLDDSTLSVAPSTIPGSLFSQVYEISRKTQGVVQVPLYDLVAVDATGAPLLDTAGRPVAPIPGSDSLEQLVNAGTPVTKVNNVAFSNVPLPLVRVVSVEFLDPLTLLPLGQTIPMRDLLLTETVSGLAVPTAGTLATGSIRHYFRDPVNVYVDRSVTRYTVGSLSYQPVQKVSELGIARVDSLLGSSVILDNTGSRADGDYTGLIAVGDRLALGGSVLAVTATAYSAVNQETTVTVRDVLSTVFGSTFSGADVVSHAGILEANMSLDPDTGMYYVDFQVESLIAGGAQPPLTRVLAFDVYSEGWSLKSTQDVLSFSTRDKPYLSVTDWVSDTTKLFVTFAAPAVRLSCEYSSSLVDIQAFSEDSANRIVGEDVLIRQFPPTYVFGSWEVSGVSTVDAKSTIVRKINGLGAGDQLESSDIVSDLYGAGATHARLPVIMVGMSQGAARDWVADYSEDALTVGRAGRFIADSTRVLVTAIV